MRIRFRRRKTKPKTKLRHRDPFDNRPTWSAAPTVEFTEAERAEIWRLNGGRS